MAWKAIARAVREQIYCRGGGRCWYCGVALDPAAFDVDHVIPVAHGGNGLDNLVPSCPPCNRGKGNRSVEVFRAIRQRKRDGAPLFIEEQLSWLHDQGFVFPNSEPYLFWFERNEHVA